MKKWVSIVFSVYLLMARSLVFAVAKQDVSAREGAKEVTEQVAKQTAKEVTEQVAKQFTREGIVEAAKGGAKEVTEQVAKQFTREGIVEAAKTGAKTGAKAARGVAYSADDIIITSASRIQKGKTSRGIQALSKKIGRGDEAYKGLKATQENVNKIIKDVMGAEGRVSNVTRNQQGIEVIDYFNPNTKLGVRLIKETSEFDTFISY